MFAYCCNNPANLSDTTGYASSDADFSFEAMTPGGGGNALGLIVGAAIGGIIASNKQNSKKPVNLPARKRMKLDMDHIISGHMPDGPRNPNGNKDVFYGLTIPQVMKAIYEAYSNSSKLKSQGVNIKLIGYSPSFNIMIEMWVDTVEYIIKTAYPK